MKNLLLSTLLLAAMPSPQTIPQLANTWTPANVPSDAYTEMGSASQSVGLGSAKMRSAFLITGSYNVKAYGAKGDWNGTTGTDDTAAIQAAITAIEAVSVGPNNSNFSCLLFPPGRYKITAPIRIRTSNIAVYGQGAELATVAAIDCVLKIGDAAFNTPQSVSINDLTLDCGSVANYGLHVIKANCIAFNSVAVNNPVLGAYYFQGATGTAIEAVMMTNCLAQLGGTTAFGYYFLGTSTPGAMTQFNLMNCSAQGGGEHVKVSGSSTNYPVVNLFGGLYENSASYTFHALSFGVINSYCAFGEVGVSQPTAYAETNGQINGFGGGFGPVGTGQQVATGGRINMIPDGYGNFSLMSFLRLAVNAGGNVASFSTGNEGGNGIVEFFSGGGKSTQFQINGDGSMNIFVGCTIGGAPSTGLLAIEIDISGNIAPAGNIAMGGGTFFSPLSSDVNFNLRGPGGPFRWIFNGTLAVAGASSGNVTLTSGVATVSCPALTAKSVVVFSLIVASGAITAVPFLTAVNFGTGFTIGAGAGDNSTYNWAIIEVN